MRPYFHARDLVSAISAVALVLCLQHLHSRLGAAEAPGIDVPEGFQVELFADDELAHDIHSLTVDSLGRVTVSGPGYVRILLDTDGDGRADQFRQFVDKPATGAQGMFWLSRSLVCSGDEGLQIFRDDNRDDKADGPPEVFLKISAGGEHHVHSIQRGPDGWWYVIAGNFAGVTGSYATIPTSPLKNPVNGVLMRLKPDLSGGEIVADGMRNAYDFAFSVSGDVFTYDSDDERDISLPWYQPTRVIQLLPLSNAGWVSDGWKRPARFADMPPVLGSFGRGSPTGVVCYQHQQFPEMYRGALFVLDWTLGRIHSLSLQAGDNGWKAESEQFASGRDQFGFAPTDAEVSPDGSLYVSVGGRGTRGSVFRISHAEGLKALPKPAPAETPEERLQQVLTANQPLSSWSRNRWMSTARALGPDVFRSATVDEVLDPTLRVRAIEILVDVFDGLALPLAERLAASDAPEVRARTAWAVGRSQPDTPDPKLLSRLAADENSFVVRSALEAVSTVSDNTVLKAMLPAIAGALSNPSRDVRLTASQLIPRLPPELNAELGTMVADQPVAKLWYFLGAQSRTKNVSVDAARHAVSLITASDSSPELRSEAVRTLQLALGDVGPATGRPVVLDGYAGRTSLENADSDLNPVRVSLAEKFPSGDPFLDHELIRVFAMTSPLNRDLFSRILASITDTTLPADDIHRLIALTQFAIERSVEESTATAKALAGIDVKIRRLKMKQDTNWDDRIGELFKLLCAVDPALPAVLPEQPGFGQPGHTLFMSQVPQSMVPKAIEQFVSVLQAAPEVSWTNELVFLIGESEKPEHRALLRQQLDNLSVRDAVLIVLSEKPQREDRALFLSGLESPQLNAVDACLKALTSLPRSNDPAEQFQLLAAARRLTNDKREMTLRETAVRLLQNNTGLDEGFVFGEEGHRPQPDKLQQWKTALEKKYPDFKPQTVSDSERRVVELLPSVNWEKGDPQRGQKLFERLSCAKCHGGRRALGPDLTGVTRRFSRDDLFAAILEPSREISGRYQTTVVTTLSGKVYTGLIVYESVDGMLLRDAEHRTYRIEGHDIESRHLQRVSLMPAGLLKDATAEDLADLYAWMKSL